MQTPPPDAPAPPERRCPRCGHAMAPDQEWCLACGAAASTEVAEPRGWRVPIMIAGGLALLAVLGVVLALVALSGGGEKLAEATPTPSPQAVPTTSPIPTATVSPLPTESAVPTETASPTGTATPAPTDTPAAGDDNTGSDTGSTTASAWPGGDGWTVIIASKSSKSAAESIATDAQGKGLTVGILDSSDFSSLNPGYQVVFTQKFDSKSAAEDSLDDVRKDYPDAYVREVKE